MKVLIIDDDSSKTTLIREFLNQQGVHQQDLLTATNAAAARQILRAQKINILLIDVLLPLRSDTSPSGEVSIDILRQIFDDEFDRPEHILGITAELSTVDQYRRSFEELVTLLVHVSPGVHEWKESLSSLLKIAKRSSDQRPRTHNIDICILNALRTPEFDSVVNTQNIDLGADQFLTRDVVYREGQIRVQHENSYSLVCAHLSQMGPTSSAHATASLLVKFQPKILIMTGICGGLAGKTQIGDLVIAQKSWDWQAGKWTPDGFQIAPEQQDASSELINIAHNLNGAIESFYEHYTHAKPKNIPVMHFGPMVSGSAVMADKEMQIKLQEQHRKIIAIDMECYSMYYSAQNFVGPDLKYLCLKSVSDLADKHKDDQYHKFCSDLSAHIGLKIAINLLQER